VISGDYPRETSTWQESTIKNAVEEEGKRPEKEDRALSVSRWEEEKNARAREKPIAFLPTKPA